MQTRASLYLAFTLAAGLCAGAMAACGSDESSIGIEVPDAAPEGAASSSGTTSSSGGSSSGGSSGGSSSGGSSSGSTSDSGTDAADASDAAPVLHSIGGTVTGLAGAGLVLQNNTGNDLAITANGSFVFSTQLASGAAYSVTVKTQPTAPAQTCTVSGGTGVVADADVSSITVNCAAGEYTVGGAVSGLDGTLVLQNNNGNDLIVTTNGTFAFSDTLSNGQAYAVTVATQPAGQTCTVTNGSGNISAANVANVAVTCAANMYSIGGVLNGLEGGKSVELKNNGADTLVRTADGSFVFATKLATGATYNVTISAQPAGQTCTVSGGTGTVGTADVTSIVVNCAAGQYTVGGTVSGLSGTVILRNNGGDDLNVTANGSFAFATPLATNATYNVTVHSNPVGQTCLVANGMGTVATSNVTNVTVTCTTNTYTIGGTITGLTGTVILQNNGGNNLTRNANGAFTFTTPIPYGGTYNVTVLTQPLGQVCTVANGSGVVGAANVTDIVVTCETKRTIGGNASGLSGSPVVLQNNGADDLTVNASGSFTFATALAEGQTYSVTVKTQPNNRTCTVSNGSGTVGTTNVVTVAVTCTP